MQSPLLLWEHEEKRRFKRHSSSLPLRVFDRGSGLGIGPLGNISLDGLMVFCGREYSPGVAINFAMVLPVLISGRRSVSFDGRCAWCKRVGKGLFEAGFEITQICASDKGALKLLTAQMS